MDHQGSLGNAIRHHRTERGLSQSHLAERVSPKLRQSDISRLERGHYAPRPELLVALATALEIRVVDLMVDAELLTESERNHFAGPHIQLADQRDAPLATEPLVIIADGGPYSAEALASLLAERSWRTEIAFDGPHLLDLVVAHRPAALLVDSYLPRLVLVNLAAVLQGERLDTCVIVLGAAPSDTPAHFSQLPRPIDLQQLLQLLATAGYS